MNPLRCSCDKLCITRRFSKCELQLALKDSAALSCFPVISNDVRPFVRVGSRDDRDDGLGVAQVEHLVMSHHGTRDHGSPVEPKTIEAFILAAVDELDSKLNQVRRAIREDVEGDEFTAWHRRLGRVLFKGKV